MSTFYKEKETPKIYYQGEDVTKVIHLGSEIYPRLGIQWADLPTTGHRIVEEAGRKWFEFMFLAPSVLAGNSAVGFSDQQGCVHLWLEQSENLANWNLGKFVPAPVPVIEREDGIFEYWSRMTNPLAAETKTATLLASSTNGNGDSRNQPFTSVVINGESQALLNFPYAMPGDAAQLQTDLEAAGWTGAVVSAATNVEWSISIPGVDFTSYAINSYVGFAQWSFVDLIFGVTIYVDNRQFRETSIDQDGTPILRQQFARLAIQPGSRYGYTSPAYPTNPVFVEPPPYAPSGATGESPPPSGVPYLLHGGWGFPTGSHEPGAILTRSTLVWENAESVVGTWWKNGMPTDSHGENYSDTVDGDLVSYREIATNSNGDSGYANWQDFAVSASVAAYLAEVGPAMEDLIGGLAGGSANMDVFSSFDHVAGTYVRNASLWVAALAGQLSCAAAWKSGGNVQSYGGVLITPRHVLYCRHAHPHAEGTWIYSSPALTLRFVLADNTVVSAIQIHQANSEVTDLCVATLDRDVESLGVHVVPILAARSTSEMSAFRSSGARVINVSQGVGRGTSTVPPSPISDYPQYNPSMVAIGPGFQSPPFDGFDYTVWDGDSGTPTFVMHRGEIFLEGILVTGGWGRIAVPMHVAEINNLISASDALAVGLGRLSAPTGLTVAAVILPFE